jgi:hypothetical protein
MTKRYLIFASFIFSVLVLSGCDQPVFGQSLFHGRADTNEETDISSQESTVSDYASLVAALEATGAEVVPGEELSQPFFEVPARLTRVNGEDVQTFEFADEETAASAASQISPDGGSTGTTMISWIASPHFYRAGRVIVLYVGDNETMTSLLESILGPQFAGR